MVVKLFKIKIKLFPVNDLSAFVKNGLKFYLC